MCEKFRDLIVDMTLWRVLALRLQLDFVIRSKNTKLDTTVASVNKRADKCIECGGSLATRHVILQHKRKMW